MTDTPTSELVVYLRSRPLDRRGMEAADRLERLEAECERLRGARIPCRNLAPALGAASGGKETAANPLSATQAGRLQRIGGAPVATAGERP